MEVKPRTPGVALKEECSLSAFAGPLFLWLECRAGGDGHSPEGRSRVLGLAGREGEEAGPRHRRGGRLVLSHTEKYTRFSLGSPHLGSFCWQKPNMDRLLQLSSFRCYFHRVPARSGARPRCSPRFGSHIGSGPLTLRYLCHMSRRWEISTHKEDGEAASPSS